jgi:hypothetical protein
MCKKSKLAQKLPTADDFGQFIHLGMCVACCQRPAGHVFSVAQICNLLYRRIAFCGTSASGNVLDLRALCRLQIGDTADYKSALRGRSRR